MKILKIDIVRIANRSNYCIGRLYINDEFFCDTLEPGVRDLKADCSGKIKAKTAIRAGRYKAVIWFSGTFKREVIRLVSVPCFSGILIHQGNIPAHTRGCILVGVNSNVGMVLSSVKTLDNLVSEIKYRIGYEFFYVNIVNDFKVL